MEETENSLDNQGTANAEIAGAESTPVTETTEQEQTQAPKWHTHAIEWAKQNGREVSSIEDLLKPTTVEVEKEVLKEVNPWEGVIDAEDEAYLTYKKETGRGREDYNKLKINYDEVDPLQLARERVRRESGLQLTDEEADEYISSQQGIDLEDMSVSDKIKLASYAKPLKDEYKAEQAKYLQPIENKPEQKTDLQPEMVKLPNGAIMLKSDFEVLETNRQKEVQNALEAIKEITPANFGVKIDDMGKERILNYSYEYGAEDVQNMASIVSDIDKVIANRYRTENGFNHKQFAEDMHWSDQKFREKAISDIATKVRAEAIEETMKLVGNHNYSPSQSLHKQTAEGVRVVSMKELAKII